MITGLDLVEWQLRIAANEPLPCSQKQIQVLGHAIECRIYAEDPQNGFLPSIGQLHFLKEPTGTGLRIDSGVTQNSHITIYYDPMIAKLIAWGDSREQALQRLQQALKHYCIGGVKTNIPFLQAITQHPHFTKATLSTNFLSQQNIEIHNVDTHKALLMAASVDYLSLFTSDDPLRTDTIAWQMHLKSHWCSRYILNDEQHNITVIPTNAHELTLKLNDEAISLRVKLSDQRLSIDDGKHLQQAWVEWFNNQLFLYTEKGPIIVERFAGQNLFSHHHSTDNQLTAPMPGTIVAILKNKGDNIKAGERLMVLEAMKMEHTIHAPYDGLLVDIFYAIGAQVNEGAELVALQATKV
jgi:3-methylcrotonyl-CoA carboxylase alpha subunit